MTLQTQTMQPVPILSTGTYLKDVAFYMDSQKARNAKGQELAGKQDGTEWNFWNINQYWQHLRESDSTRIYPGSRRWSESLLRSRQGYADEEIEQLTKKFSLTKNEVNGLIQYVKGLSNNMVSGNVEIVNTIVAHPLTEKEGREARYSKKIRIQGVNKGKNAIVIDEPIVVKEGGSLYLELDKQNPQSELFEVGNYPRNDGNLKNPIPELGLPRNGYLWVDWNPEYEDGLRAVHRSAWLAEFDALARWDPSPWDWDGGFRLGSEATADISAKLKKYTINEAQKQIIVDASKKIGEIPTISVNEIPTVTRNIGEELNKLLSELHSE